MDFFEHQDNAKQQTRNLVLLFITAILIILAAVNLIGFVAWLFSLNTSIINEQGWTGLLVIWFQTELSWYIAAATLALIIIGSGVQWYNLSSGGPAVAEMVQAQHVSSYQNNESVQRYIHVVEEMAIASGTPVPQLYVMDRESGINAFVAGYQIEDTVMVVTQGLLDTLDRNEIQAVAGHEFSHIFNGDMRLNMRLISLLSGILMIGQFGRFLISTNRRSRHSYRSSRKSSGVIPVILIGIALWMVGSIGVFFGRLIKSAVSRQREFLADASAVQFTRNPDALASALNKIRESSSMLRSRHAEDMSHLCFGSSGSQASWLGNLATHPPLEERIQRVAPTFLTKLKHERRHNEVFIEPTSKQGEAGYGSAFNAGIAAGALLTSENIIKTVGTRENIHLVLAKSLHKKIPIKLQTFLHQSAGAKAFCIALILRDIEDVKQLQQAMKLANRQNSLPINNILPWVKAMPVELRLPCIDICLPTLKQFDSIQRIEFIKKIESLAKLDNHINTTEWLVISQLRVHLLPKHANRNNKSIGSLLVVNTEIQILLSALVHTETNLTDATKTYKNIINAFGLKDQWLMSQDAVGYSEISMALWRLRDLNFLLKKPLLQACADIVLTDKLLSTEEFELLRVVSDSLGCPLPPLTESLAH